MNDDNRYERKFIIQNASLSCLKNIRFLLPADLHEIYSERLVNSIYYDTGNFLLAKSGLEGHSYRFKVRIRYYGNIEDFKYPILEVKFKKGDIGNKYKISLKKEDIIDKDFKISKFLDKGFLPYEFQNILSFLQPKVFISYKRNYYITNSEKFRFTFDKDINFKSINMSKPLLGIIEKPSFRYLKKIIELKYHKENQTEAHKIVQKIPFRLTSISKYNTALAYLSII